MLLQPVFLKGTIATTVTLTCALTASQGCSPRTVMLEDMVLTPRLQWTMRQRCQESEGCSEEFTQSAKLESRQAQKMSAERCLKHIFHHKVEHYQKSSIQTALDCSFKMYSCI